MLVFVRRAAVRPATILNSSTLFGNNVTPPSIASASLSNNSKKADADLVVVGAGVAGICASIAAAEKGASVVLVDAGYGGGASALSGGVVYAGGGTTQQKAAGYGHDTPENMYAYLKEETRDAVDEETLRRFCNTSAESLRWLEKHGVKFEASLCPYKTSYPTDQYYLYFSGSEKSHPYNKIVKPVPRGHRAVHPGMSGSELWRVLFKSAMGLGVRFIPSSKITKVLFDEKKRVNGIEIKTLPSSNPSFPRHEKLVKKGVQYQLRLPPLAKWYQDRATQIWNQDSQLQKLHAPSVVLACGGFTYNQEMRQRYMPQFSRVGPLGTFGDDGSGIAVGQSAGGSVAKLNRMSAWCFIYPPTALVEGVVVSSQGHRMISEDIYGAALTETMVLKHNSTGFLILDQNQWTKVKKQVFKQTQSPILLQRLHWLYWGHKKAESLGALAAKLGIAEAGLEETISAYDHAIATDSEDPMHKMPEYRSPILKPPFYGIDLSVKGTGVQPVLGLTLGGLRVDGRTGLVLTGDDTKIDGLYAAGRTAVGVCANSYVSGLSIADCVFSGRRAGEDAVSKMIFFLALAYV